MDSIPLMAKWMTAVQTNKTASRDCIIDSATVEYLAVNHQYAPCMYVCAADDVRRGVTDCRGLLGHPCSMVRACALGRERLTCVCRTIGPGTAGSNLYIETDQAHGTQLNWLTDPHATNDWGASEVRCLGARLCSGGGDARADHVLVVVCTGARGTCESQRLVERVCSAVM